MAKRIATKELTHDNWADEEEPEEMGTFRQASSQQMSTRQIKKARRRGAPESPSATGIFKGLAPFSGFGNIKDSASQPTFSFLSKETASDDAPKPSFSFFNNINSNSTADNTKSELGSSGKKTVTQPLQFSQGSVSASAKSSDTVKTNGLDPSTGKSTNGTSGKCGSKQFLAHLKSLNEGVLSWVKQHLDKNPHVDLTPVFDDYKKHFEGLIKKYPPSRNESDADLNAGDSNKDEASEKENKPLVEKTSKESTSAPAFSFGILSSPSKPLDPKPFSFGTDTKVAEQKEDSKDSTEKPLFTFGVQDSKTSEGSIFGKASTRFVFGGIGSGQSGTTGFSFTKSDATEETKSSGEGANADEPSDEPPVVEVKEVKEEDAFYEQKCKLFYMKDGAYVEKGVGTLFLKPAGDKTQLLVRALTNLGNILLNIFLTKSIPAVRAGKNGIMIACIPNPPLEANKPSTDPVKMLIRVKTGEDADQLLEKINELKN